MNITNEHLNAVAELLRPNPIGNKKLFLTFTKSYLTSGTFVKLFGAFTKEEIETAETSKTGFVGIRDGIEIYMNRQIK